jgi:hypothetical protein
MFLRKAARPRLMRAAILCLILSCVAVAGFAQKKHKAGKDDSQREAKKERALERGTPVLWREPVDIASRDLFLGPGGEAMKPDLSRVTLIEEEKGGYSKKYRVRDGAGQEWIAKIGNEAQSETAAVRLMWAIGYVTEINYLVPHLKIEGKGDFDNVRLEARPKNIKRLGEWKWDDNPFKGTQEFQGLKVLMIVFNNWDIKDDNNKILDVRSEGGQDELWYIISDLGATFGANDGPALAWRLTHNRNVPQDYNVSPFIERIKGEYVDFHYGGKRKDLFKDITRAQAKWLGDLLGRLSNQQIEDAFRAANYKPDEVLMLRTALRKRISTLVSLQP